MTKPTPTERVDDFDFINDPPDYRTLRENYQIMADRALELATELEQCQKERDEFKRLASIGKRWETNSALEEWFPISAERLATMEAKLNKARELFNAAVEMLGSIKSANTDLYSAAYDRLEEVNPETGVKRFEWSTNRAERINNE